LYFVAWRQTVSDCGCTPATASNTAIAPSSTRKRTFDFRREIHVAGRVDDVHALLDAFENLVNAFFFLLHPRAGRRRRSDRDAALAFLLHPVGHGRAFVHLTDLVDHAGVKQNALGQRRLAGIDVRGDADVPRPLERELAVRRIRIRRSWFFSSVAVAIRLPAEMSKGAVCLRHLVSVVALLDRVALAGAASLISARALRPSAWPRRLSAYCNDPAHRERNLTRRRHFHRHLVGGATNPA
jgi:hypothetical protein